MEAPPSDVVRVRPRLWRDGVAGLAVVGYLVGDFLLSYFLGEHVDDDTLWRGWTIMPWLLGVPFLRRASMSPSAWFVISLVIPYSAFFLVGRLTYRLMSLPARDWEPAWWELDRVLRIRENPRLWVLAEPLEQPARVRLAPPTGSRLWSRFKWASRNAWLIVFPAFAAMLLIGLNDVTAWFAIPVVLGMLLVAIAPVFAVTAAERLRTKEPTVPA